VLLYHQADDGERWGADGLGSKPLGKHLAYEPLRGPASAAELEAFSKRLVEMEKQAASDAQDMSLFAARLKGRRPIGTLALAAVITAVFGLQVLLDGADPLSAARVGGILRATAASFDPTLRAVPARGRASPSVARGPVDLRGRFWFNATLTDRDFFLATLAGMLLTNLCLSVTSLGLVGERESGTYEQTLALPTRPLEMVLGKLVPYVVVCYGVLAIPLLGAGLGFGIWPRGSLPALLLLTLPFVLGSLAIGVFVSTLARSSAQAVFITVFFIMPSFVLSGVLLPYQLMPDGVRQVGALLPLRWYQIGLRRIVARGGGLDDVAVPLLALTLFFAAMLALIRWRLRPRLA
jgi:ABC-2 type transport system permease protein